LPGRRSIPLAQLDPASPPAPFSPAGQALKRTAQLIRQQVQRTATERDKLARKLAYSAQVAARQTHTLDSLPDEPPVAPLPPYYRSPVPVRYPEVARDTVRVEEAESEQTAPPSRARSRLRLPMRTWATARSGMARYGCRL
jgi:hypothetical protein